MWWPENRVPRRLRIDISPCFFIVVRKITRLGIHQLQVPYVNPCTLAVFLYTMSSPRLVQNELLIVISKILIQLHTLRKTHSMAVKKMPSSKRTVLITGCSDGGLGAALATAFHKAGLHVYATAQNDFKITQVASPGIKTLTLNVQFDSSIAACVSTLSDLDILINNADVG